MGTDNFRIHRFRCFISMTFDQKFSHVDGILPLPPLSHLPITLQVMHYCFEDYAMCLSRAAAAPGSSSGRERRKGREGEMAAACEGLQLLMSLPIVPTGDIREVVMLYLKLAGFFDMQVLPPFSLPQHSLHVAYC